MEGLRGELSGGPVCRVFLWECGLWAQLSCVVPLRAGVGELEP